MFKCVTILELLELFQYCYTSFITKFFDTFCSGYTVSWRWIRRLFCRWLCSQGYIGRIMNWCLRRHKWHPYSHLEGLPSNQCHPLLKFHFWWFILVLQYVIFIFIVVLTLSHVVVCYMNSVSSYHWCFQLQECCRLRFRCCLHSRSIRHFHWCWCDQAPLLRSLL
jgi:hypothetical protein